MGSMACIISVNYVWKSRIISLRFKLIKIEVYAAKTGFDLEGIERFRSTSITYLICSHPPCDIASN